VNNSYKRLLKSPDETEKSGKEFAKILKPGDFVSLTGLLGAGKTKFVSGIVNYLCADFQDLVSSPTYAIMNRYSCSVLIDHFDFYRLKDILDLENCGFFNSILSNSIVIAEWGDKILFDYKNLLKGNYYEINISFSDENIEYREITINKLNTSY
jgi:tRNA threonylcarbamoyladenosine biosynthesis protein TsaE